MGELLVTFLGDRSHYSLNAGYRRGLEPKTKLVSVGNDDVFINFPRNPPVQSSIAYASNNVDHIRSRHAENVDYRTRFSTSQVWIRIGKYLDSTCSRFFQRDQPFAC